MRRPLGVDTSWSLLRRGPIKLRDFVQRVRKDGANANDIDDIVAFLGLGTRGGMIGFLLPHFTCDKARANFIERHGHEYLSEAK